MPAVPITPDVGPFSRFNLNNIGPEKSEEFGREGTRPGLRERQHTDTCEGLGPFIAVAGPDRLCDTITICIVLADVRGASIVLVGCFREFRRSPCRRSRLTTDVGLHVEGTCLHLFAMQKLVCVLHDARDAV